jgi:branched-chain amino acid transport system permease protein
LSVLLTRTRFGRAIRATVQNPEAATLLGVDANRVQTLSFGLGVSMAAAAGAVYGVLYPFNPGSHYDLISRLLSIVVLGGLGSLGGAIVAALAMGIIEAVVAVEISPTWAAFSFFIVLIGFLLARPQGIFGVRERTL